MNPRIRIIVVTQQVLEISIIGKLLINKFKIISWMWYLTLKHIEDWIVSKDIPFFHREIHLLSERWQKIIGSDER